MSRVYTAPQCKYVVDDNRIITDKSVIHKVSGTSMGGILNVSPWSSPFQVACNLLGLGKEDISGKPSVEAGKILEPVIISYSDKKFSEYGMFIPADEIFNVRTGDHDAWISDFEDDVFAGHVDGAVIDSEGKDYILEIKTTTNLDSWKEGIPSYYYWQVALYNEFLSKKDKAYVVLGMLDNYALKDPYCWSPTELNTVIYAMNIDRAGVNQILSKVREWYAEYILQGVTPPYNPDNPGDVELFEHLVSLQQSVDEVKDKLGKLAEIEDEIKVRESESQILYADRDALKDEIKAYMVAHDLKDLKTENGAEAVISTSHRKSISKELLIQDGLDPSRYTTETITKSFTIKRK